MLSFAGERDEPLHFADGGRTCDLSQSMVRPSATRVTFSDSAIFMKRSYNACFVSSTGQAAPLAYAPWRNASHRTMKAYISGSWATCAR